MNDVIKHLLNKSRHLEWLRAVTSKTAENSISAETKGRDINVSGFATFRRNWVGKLGFAEGKGRQFLVSDENKFGRNKVFGKKSKQI